MIFDPTYNASGGWADLGTELYHGDSERYMRNSWHVFSLPGPNFQDLLFDDRSWTKYDNIHVNILHNQFNIVFAKRIVCVFKLLLLVTG
jgi:hypothetical protein